MKYLYSNKYWEPNKDYNIDKLLYLMVDKPNEINDHGKCFIWKNKNEQFHRDYDFPSNVFIYKEICNLHWFINNKQHREKSKPAYINGHDGLKAYFINNNFIKREYSK